MLHRGKCTLKTHSYHLQMLSLIYATSHHTTWAGAPSSDFNEIGHIPEVHPENPLRNPQPNHVPSPSSPIRALFGRSVVFFTTKTLLSGVPTNVSAVARVLETLLPLHPQIENIVQSLPLMSDWSQKEQTALCYSPTLRESFSSSASRTSVCLSRQRLTAWMPKLRTGWVRRNSEMELK